GVTKVSIFHRGGGQCGFDLQNSGSLRCRLVRGISKQFQHLRDMLCVSLAKLRGFVVFLQVVFALRQSETALKRCTNHLSAVFGVLRRIEAKERADALAVQVLGYSLEVATVLIEAMRARSGSIGFVPAASMVAVSMQLA